MGVGDVDHSKPLVCPATGHTHCGFWPLWGCWARPLFFFCLLGLAFFVLGSLGPLLDLAFFFVLGSLGLLVWGFLALSFLSVL